MISGIIYCLINGAVYWGQAIMAGHDSGSQHQFTGFKKYFNSHTIIGRRNYVLLTYGSFLALFIGYKMRKPKEISRK